MDFLKTETVACGFDFPIDEYDVIFTRLFDCCESKSSNLPKDIIAQLPNDLDTSLGRRVQRVADYFHDTIKHVGEKDIEKDRDPLRSRFCIFNFS